MHDFAVERLTSTGTGDEAWLRAIQASLGALRARVRPTRHIVWVLPPHLTLTKALVLPRVSAAKRAKVIRFEAAHAVPGGLMDVAWGSVEAGEVAAECEHWLAAGKRAVLRELAAIASAGGFAPDEMLPSPLATLGAARLALSGGPEPALVINLGARSATLLQVEARRFATRTLAFGPPAVAPGEYGARLAQEVTRTLLHFGRRQHAVRPAQVYLTGGGAGLPGLEAALAEALALPVRRLDVLGAVDIARNAAPAGMDRAGGEIGDVVGAAALWYDSPGTALNLLPPALQRRAWLRRRQAWLMAAALVLLAALLPPLWHHRRIEAAARGKTAALEAALAPVRERASRLRAAESELAALRRQADLLQGVHQRRVAWQQFLADLETRLVQGEDVWFERLHTLPPAAGAPLKIAVSGRLLDPADLRAKAGAGTPGRVRLLLAGLLDSPFIASVEAERFDTSQAGILRFDFVLVTEPTHAL